jgi:hypothetical protein
MSTSTELFYSSANGDRWQLVKNAETGHFAIRHEPNLALGGQVSEVDIADFLSRNGRSPQADALRVLLGKQGIMDMEDE